MQRSAFIQAYSSLGYWENAAVYPTAFNFGGELVTSAVIFVSGNHIDNRHYPSHTLDLFLFFFLQVILTYACLLQVVLLFQILFIVSDIFRVYHTMYFPFS